MKRDDFSDSRRDFLKKAGLASAAVLSVTALSPVVSGGNLPLADWLGTGEARAAENRTTINDKLKTLYGDRRIEMSHVTMKTPIIAENGAVVPVEVSADLPMDPDNYVKKITIFVDNNLDPYIASTELTPASGRAALALRIKMRKTSPVRAVVETSKGKLYGATNNVKVTIGGCGG